jgi:hypothetical protein
LISFWIFIFNSHKDCFDISTYPVFDQQIWFTLERPHPQHWIPRSSFPADQ